MTSDCVSVFVTCGTRDEAQGIARALVEEGLAACVNILDGCTSVYRWKGEVRSDQEFVLLVKTQRDLADRVCSRVEDHHSYEMPCVVVLPLAGGSSRFLEWIRTATTA